ncbi:MAG: hypothetical protein Q4C04_04885 [Clostridia bacterium]|nr:hypothetical protein [Clostridia bacterium]
MNSMSKRIDFILYNKSMVVVMILAALLLISTGCDTRIRQNDKNTEAYYNEYVELVSSEGLWVSDWVLYKDETPIGADEGIDLGGAIPASDIAEQIELFRSLLNQTIADESPVDKMTAYDVVGVGKLCMVNCDSTLSIENKQYSIENLNIMLYNDERIVSTLTYTEEGQEHTMCLYLRFPYDDLLKNTAR